MFMAYFHSFSSIKFSTKKYRGQYLKGGHSFGLELNLLVGDIILKFFSENRTKEEFQEVIVEYKKAFVPNL